MLILYLLIIVYPNIISLYILISFTMSLSYIGQNCMCYCYILTTTSLLQCCTSAITTSGVRIQIMLLKVGQISRTLTNICYSTDHRTA